MDVDPDQDPADDVEFVVLGGPGDGPTLRLDHERFAYAGKFVMSGTGKAVVRERGGDRERGSSDEGEYDDDVLAAVAFDRDRTDGDVLRIRYVTVRRDRRGEGLGPRLLASVAERALDGGLEGGMGREASSGTTEDAGRWSSEPVREVRIAVNNPFAYEAAYKAGFGYTGERTGLAELTCARPGDRSPGRYRRGLSTFRERGSLDQSERAFLDDRQSAGPPPVVGSPPSR